jgi:hypothetical protein
MAHDDHFHCYDHAGPGAVAHTRTDTWRRGGPPPHDLTFYSLTKDLAALAARSAGRATVTSLGKTPTARGNREIWRLKLGTGAGKPKILFTGGLHAREWIGPTYVYLIAEWLIDNYAAVPAAKDIVDNAEIHFVPMCNPDGHEYTVTTYRLWRKNSPAGDPDFQTAPSLAAAGVQAGAPESVDLNRNFDSAQRAAVIASGRGVWSSSSDEDVYVGSGAGSAFETSRLQALITAEKYDVVVDHHSFGCFALHAPGDDSRPLATIDPPAGARNASFAAQMRTMFGSRAALIRTTRPATADAWTVMQSSHFYSHTRGTPVPDGIVPGSIKDFGFYTPTGRFIVATTTGDLNVRSGPSVGSPIVGALPRGTIVEAGAVTTGFRELGPGRFARETFLKPARPLAFTFELPPMHYVGSPGFELPETLIRAVFRTCLPLNLALIKYARKGEVSAADFGVFAGVP